MNSLENLKDLIIYQSQKNENISIEVLYDNEDFWLTPLVNLPSLGC